MLLLWPGSIFKAQPSQLLRLVRPERPGTLEA